MKKTALTLVGIVAAGTALAPSTSFAHGAMQADHGGQITESGPVRVEFAIRDNGVRAWVRDHDGQPKAAEGKVMLMTAKGMSTVPLQGENGTLSAQAALSSGEAVTAILSLNVDGKPVSVRFTQAELVRPELSAQTSNGKQNFDSACAKCHGPSLRGTDQGPPLLNPIYAPMNHGDDMVLAAMKNGAPQHMWKFGSMPKPQGLAPNAEPDVLAYIRAMQKANGIGADAPAPAINMIDMPAGHEHHH